VAVIGCDYYGWIDSVIVSLCLNTASLSRINASSGTVLTPFRQLFPVNPNPTLFESREAAEPYSRGQWDSALRATPHSPKGDVSYVRALKPTARSGAHGFRSRRRRSLLTVLNYCRIRVKSTFRPSRFTFCARYGFSFSKVTEPKHLMSGARTCE
jgi:hypothetical protein